MMQVVRKKLWTGARGEQKSELCLVISFEDGIKAQYPVANYREAIALYAHYSRLHPCLDAFDGKECAA